MRSAFSTTQVTTAWSACGSTGLLLLADTAQATIIPATIAMYAPRANSPSISFLPAYSITIANDGLAARLSLIFG